MQPIVINAVVERIAYFPFGCDLGLGLGLPRKAFRPWINVQHNMGLCCTNWIKEGRGVVSFMVTGGLVI